MTFRLRILLLLFLALATSASGLTRVNALGATVAPKATTNPVTGELAREIVKRGERDRDVRDRLALQGGAHEADVVKIVEAERPASIPGVDLDPGGTRYQVRWRQHGETRMTADVSLDLHRVTRVLGHAVPVMPGPPRSNTDEQQQSWRPWALLILFAATVFAWRGRLQLRVGIPLLVLGLLHVITLANLVPSDLVRVGNMVLYGAPVVALLAGAVLWARTRDHAGGTHEIRRVPPAWSSGIIVISTLGWQVWTMVRSPMVTDVALASEAGAFLMARGVPVYGNMLDIPGSLSHGDTYGPAAYLAYAPASRLFDSVQYVVVGTNIVLEAIVAVALVALGARLVDVRTGALAAATWITCPFVAMGVVTGNNDIVVAVCSMVLVLGMSRPAVRGAALGTAAAAKFLPIVALASVIRLGGENARAARVTVVTATATLLVLFAIGFRGIDVLPDFWERSIKFQLQRDDLASIWGLTGLAPLRYVIFAGAGFLALRLALASRRGTMTTVTALLGTASLLSLPLAALPQYWGTYVTWLVPVLLGARLYDEMRPRTTRPQTSRNTTDTRADEGPPAAHSLRATDS